MGSYYDSMIIVIYNSPHFSHSDPHGLRNRKNFSFINLKCISCYSFVAYITILSILLSIDIAHGTVFVAKWKLSFLCSEFIPPSTAMILTVADEYSQKSYKCKYCLPKKKKNNLN